MTKINWQEPPERTRGAKAVKYLAEAEALRANPGAWAIVMVARASSSAFNINAGNIAAFQPAGVFEATSRKRDDGKFDIYVRYVGETA